MEQLKGKVAVVTGAASGIGAALAERFAAEDMRVMLADVDEAGLTAVADRLATGGTKVATARCDTSIDADVRELATQTVDRFGAAHVLCNNAGVAGLCDAWLAPMTEWERTIGVNLLGVVHGIRSFLPVMTEQGEGHIVNTASIAGLGPFPGGAPYCATKHAVVGISESLYLELKVTGSPIEVSVLCPGWVQTRIMDHGSPELTTPMAALGEQVAKAAVDAGIQPAEVADLVIEAVRTDRFWILTHDDTGAAAVARMQRAADGVNPTLAM